MTESTMVVDTNLRTKPTPIAAHRRIAEFSDSERSRSEISGRARFSRCEELRSSQSLVTSWRNAFEFGEEYGCFENERRVRIIIVEPALIGVNSIPAVRKMEAFARPLRDKERGLRMISFGIVVTRSLENRRIGDEGERKCFGNISPTLNRNIRRNLSAGILHNEIFRRLVRLQPWKIETGISYMSKVTVELGLDAMS